MNWKNILILSGSNMFSVSAVAIMVLMGGIVGAELAPNPSLSTLPSSLMVVGLAITTIPATMLMRRVGRQFGFIISGVVATAGALLAAYAVTQESFTLFCLGALMVGTNSAYVQQYRFAAAESVAPKLTGRAVSLVLVGGILAGYVGPAVAERTQDLIPGWVYAGSFIGMAGLYVLVILLMLFYRQVTREEVETQAKAVDARPLRDIISQPMYITALLAGMSAYGVMSFIMTATPVQMHQLAGFTLGQTSIVIQSHIVAMFLPSLFTGYLLERLGVIRVMLIGLAALFICVVLGTIGEALLHYWSALVLLGVGWNFLFVGATVLLTKTYLPAERYKAQGFNDFSIFSVQALLSLSAGAVLYRSNWVFLNLVTLPLLVLVLVLILRIRNRVEKPVMALSSEGSS